jgi:hypothetical protein
VLTLRAAVAGQAAPDQAARAAIALQELGIPVTPRALDLARSALTESPGQPLGDALQQLLDSGADPQLAALLVDTPTADALQQAVTLLADPPEATLADALDAAADATADAPAAPAPMPRAPSDAGIPAESARTVLARSAGSPDLPAAVRALAQTLHDRVELQQLANAVALSRADGAATGTDSAPSRAAARLPAGVPGAIGVPAAPAGTNPLSAATQLAQQSPLALSFSIPLALGGQVTTLDLTVHRDPPSSRHGADPAEAPVRAQLALRLPHLGDVGVDLRLAGSALRCRLTAQPGTAHDTLAAAAGDLRDRWLAAGFQVDALDCVPAVASNGDKPPRPVHLRHVDLGA